MRTVRGVALVRFTFSETLLYCIPFIRSVSAFPRSRVDLAEGLLTRKRMLLTR